MVLNRSLRSLAERFSRGVVLKRRLPREFGGARLYVTPEARLNLWRHGLRKCDPALLELAREVIQPKDVVWDIGANVGLFAFTASYFAGPAGRVYAFEPDLLLVQLMRRSAAEIPAGHAPVHLVPVAVSDHVGVTEFHIAKRRAANSLLVEASLVTGGFVQTEIVPVFSIDTILDHLPAPRVVKIDVEAAEKLVFKGAERLLREVKPTLIVETTERNMEWNSQWLAGFGYRFYDADAPKCDRPQLDRMTYNTLALPADGR
jgi:FkbM family methyltransferase